MQRWLSAAALAVFLAPFAGNVVAGCPPCSQAKKSAPPAAAAPRSCGEPCDMPEDERQAYQELLDIIRTTDSPDTFMAAVAALLGADGAEKRYARLAVPVVIRNAERLGVLKGIASAEELTPVQKELLDYLEGAAAIPQDPPADGPATPYIRTVPALPKFPVFPAQPSLAP
jgi:hypothetical protein